jgi:hypothetical protein
MEEGAGRTSAVLRPGREYPGAGSDTRGRRVTPASPTGSLVLLPAPLSSRV